MSHFRLIFSAEKFIVKTSKIPKTSPGFLDQTLPPGLQCTASSYTLLSGGRCLSCCCEGNFQRIIGKFCESFAIHTLLWFKYEHWWQNFVSLYYPMNHMTEITTVEEFRFVIFIFRRHLLKSSLLTFSWIYFCTVIFFFEPQFEDRSISQGPNRVLVQFGKNIGDQPSPLGQKKHPFYFWWEFKLP